MESLANDRLTDRLAEEFDKAMFDDYNLRAALAEETLESWEYYLFCKEDGELDLEHIYGKIEEQFFNSEASCFDIRELAKKAYPKLEI
jgi:hypothetical protein